MPGKPGFAGVFTAAAACRTQYRPGLRSFILSLTAQALASLPAMRVILRGADAWSVNNGCGRLVRIPLLHHDTPHGLCADMLHGKGGRDVYQSQKSTLMKAHPDSS